ncbi:GNAT family N-acetyltransferase [Streptomyces sp. NPDC058695]|uniref:GNAT family N-acetyltransferase n=1 Tax=Streptomyces sp. NPDC058695 TaxID=3346604 RepID=UPI003658AC9B
MEVALRAVEESDVRVFFRHMNDPEAARVAAFVSPRGSDWDHFEAHWKRIRSSSDVVRAVVADGELVGSAAVYGEPGDLQVTYWIDRAHWGRGLATAALRALLAEVPERPLHARAATDNIGSLRVLEKCGFRVTGQDSGFAHARGKEIPESVLVLDA